MICYERLAALKSLPFSEIRGCDPGHGAPFNVQSDGQNNKLIKYHIWHKLCKTCKWINILYFIAKITYSPIIVKVLVHYTLQKDLSIVWILAKSKFHTRNVSETCICMLQSQMTVAKYAFRLWLPCTIPLTINNFEWNVLILDEYVIRFFPQGIEIHDAEVL